MSRFKGTKGPWAKSSDGVLSGPDGSRVIVRHVGLVTVHWDESEAIRNDQAIAAVPEMIAALQSAEESIVAFMGVHDYPIESGAGLVLAEVRAALDAATKEETE